MHPEQTSISDYEAYREICRKASCDATAFETFRTNLHYTAILEHVSVEQGYNFLISTATQSPHFLQYLDRFKENDLYGGAAVHDFGPHIGVVSPSTLRYVKILSDLTFIFGSLNNMKIVEIGGGYGGQCTVISKMYPYFSYTIIDLPEASALQRRYLETANVKNVNCWTVNDLYQPLECDLLISNYAFSEVNKELAKLFLDKCISHASRGYMICNHIDKDVYSQVELRQLLPNAIVFPEVPLTHPDNYTLVWKSPNSGFVQDQYKNPPAILA